MRIWLITIGEPLPTDSDNERLLRTGLLAERLSESGHQVVWWTSAFDHRRKKFRTAGDLRRAGTRAPGGWRESEQRCDHADAPRRREKPGSWGAASLAAARFFGIAGLRLASPSANAPQEINGNYQIRFLRGTGYRGNISLRRFIDHRLLARGFRKAVAEQEPPDVILSSLPTVELCREATRYGRRRGVPVVLDVRDLWPDVLFDVVPPVLRPAVRRSLGFLSREARQACSEATGVTGISEGMVDWALAYAGRPRSLRDRAFPMGYRDRRPPDEAVAKARQFWKRHGLAPANRASGPESSCLRGTLHGSAPFLVCFFGSIGRHFEMETAIEAARLLGRWQVPVRFVLCGSGPDWKRWRRRAADCPNVTLPGWVDAAAIWTLMRMAHVGLAPYRSRWDFRLSIPNKPIEYLSAGLPVVSTLQGTLAELLRRNDCGITCLNGDPVQLARAISECRERAERRRQMSNNARALFERQFRAERVYADMQRYLEGVASTATIRRAA